MASSSVDVLDDTFACFEPNASFIASDHRQQSDSFFSSCFPSSSSPSSSVSTMGNGDKATMHPYPTNDSGQQTISVTSDSDGMHNSYHCHDVLMNEAQSKDSRTAMIKLIYGLIICAVFMCVELVGGHLSHSLAIFTDAAHLFSDMISFGISLVALYLSTRPATKSQTFGYLRVEIIGVLFSVFLIWFLTGILVYLAILRLIHGDYEIHSESMLVVAMIGLFMNMAMWMVLADPCHRGQQNRPEEMRRIHDKHQHHDHHQHHRGHHGHSHMNMNVRAAILHILGDMIQSVGVLLAAIIIHYRPQWKLADPICTLLFAMLVFMTTYSIMKDTLHILMEGFPAEYSYEQVRQMLLKQIQGVQHVHSLHIWSLTHGRNAITVHLAVADGHDFECIRNQAESLIRQELTINEITIQVERHHPHLIESCSSCFGPTK